MYNTNVYINYVRTVLISLHVYVFNACEIMLFIPTILISYCACANLQYFKSFSSGKIH